jgi:exonuclease III
MGLTTPPCQNSLSRSFTYRKAVRTRGHDTHGQRKPSNEMFIATWNICSLYQLGASRKLEEELEKYKVDTAAVQETWWKSTEIVELKKYVLINIGSDCGTGFMISKKLKGNIIGYNLINEKNYTIQMRIHKTEVNCTAIQRYYFAECNL